MAIGVLDDHLSRTSYDPTQPRPAPGPPVANVVSDEEWEAAFADIERLTAGEAFVGENRPGSIGQRRRELQ